MLKKILLGLLAVILLAVVGIFVFVQMSWNKNYDVAYPTLTASTDSAIIAQGKYLVHGPAHCANCHLGSIDDFVKAEMGQSVSLSGGFKMQIGPLATLYTANLAPDTETGIGRYTDGELFRMMRHAIKPDGTSTLSPLMPFFNMSDEDMVAVVSYLRSTEAVKNEVPAPEYTFMGKAIRTFTPVFDPILDPTPTATSPEEAVTPERGEYIARYVANCVGCHTARDQQTMEQIGEEFGGGFLFEPMPELNQMAGLDPDIWTRSPNITGGEGGVLGNYPNAEAWIARFRQGRTMLHSPMPWGSFAAISDTDLEAMYVYLKGLSPVDNDPGPVNFKME